MKKALVFGSGKYFNQKRDAIKEEIVGFVDNFKEGDIEGKKIYRPEEIMDIEYDLLYIMAGADLVGVLTEQCLKEGIDYHKLVFGQNMQPSTGWESIFMNTSKPLSVDKSGLIYDSGKVKIRVSEPRELSGIAEMVGGNVYGYGMPGKENVIIDIGMNIGIASLYFASREDVSKVYSYEPFRCTYQKALANIALNKGVADKIVHRNAGISNATKKEKVIFNECMHGALTTCQEFVSEAIDYYKKCSTYEKESERTEEIQLLDAGVEVKRILTENDGKSMILKMDCEGSEYLIMEELERQDLLKYFSIIMLEWHYRGSKDLKERLKRAGFAFFEYIINERYGIINAVRITS